MNKESLRIATWNISGGLQNEAKARAIIDVIEEINPDVMVLQEALMNDAPQVKSFFEGGIEDRGYDSATASYATSGELSRYKMLALARVGLKGAHTPLSIGGQNAHYLHISGHAGPLELYGVHLDSFDSDVRNQQAQRLAHITTTDIPAIVLGDFNAMHSESNKARLLQRCVPLVDGFKPRHEVPLVAERNFISHLNSKILRVKGVSKRLVGMASGDTLRLLKDSGLSDADPQSLSTHVTRTQLDHIFVNGHIEIVDFQRWSRMGLSDHNPISVDIVTR